MRADFARRDGRETPPQPAALCPSFIFGSRGLGDNENIRLDVGIDTGHLALRPADQFLLCSDGLSGAMDAAQLGARLTEPPPRTATETAHDLAQAAMAAGATNNITAIVLHALTAPAPEEETQWNRFDDEPTVPQVRPAPSDDGSEPL